MLGVNFKIFPSLSKFSCDLYNMARRIVQHYIDGACGFFRKLNEWVFFQSCARKTNVRVHRERRKKKKKGEKRRKKKDRKKEKWVEACTLWTACKHSLKSHWILTKKTFANKKEKKNANDFDDAFVFGSNFRQMRVIQLNFAFFMTFVCLCVCIFSALGAAYGTAKSGTGIAAMSVMRPELIMKSIIPVVMAGIIAIYGLVVAVLIAGQLKEAKAGYTLFQ